MSPNFRRLASRLIEEARSHRRILAVVAAYACGKALMCLVTDRYGLIAPTGSPNLAVAALGLAFLAVRLGVLFGVPAVVGYRVSSRLYQKFVRTTTRHRNA